MTSIIALILAIISLFGVSLALYKIFSKKQRIIRVKQDAEALKYLSKDQEAKAIKSFLKKDAKADYLRMKSDKKIAKLEGRSTSKYPSKRKIYKAKKQKQETSNVAPSHDGHIWQE